MGFTDKSFSKIPPCGPPASFWNILFFSCWMLCKLLFWFIVFTPFIRVNGVIIFWGFIKLFKLLFILIPWFWGPILFVAGSVTKMDEYFSNTDSYKIGSFLSCFVSTKELVYDGKLVNLSINCCKAVVPKMNKGPFPFFIPSKIYFKAIVSITPSINLLFIIWPNNVLIIFNCFSGYWW